MTKDEFINFDMDDGMVVLTGDLANVEGKFLLVKGSGEEDGALARPEDYSDFVPGYAHAFINDGIMRYHCRVGDISMIELVPEGQNREG